MNGKLIPACGTPTDATERDHYEQIVQTFSPVVRFDPAERFFPVDLVSAIEKSAIYQFDSTGIGTPIVPPFRNYGEATPLDLSVAGMNSFTTLMGWDMEERQEPAPLREFPVPRPDAIYERYSGGGDPTFTPRLTTYATICRVTEEVPNYHFFEQFLPSFMPLSAALQEQSGVLLNYYFYFPAMESTSRIQESDWSGISLFFERMPNMSQLDEYMPILACYFRKIGDLLITSSPEGPNGFRLWGNVEKLPDLETTLLTHPVVYISRGSHNCYYLPLEQPILAPAESPWYPVPDPDKVESGDYSPGPAVNHVVGGWKPSFPWYVYVTSFGLVFLFEICGYRGCQFDEGGVSAPSGYEQEEDIVQSGGYESDPDTADTGTTPGSDSYPSESPSGPVNILLNVIYVDLEDPDSKYLWGYEGFWGAAKRVMFAPYWIGFYKGIKRPNLAPWFLWNLFWDAEFGSDGGASGYQNNGP